MARKNPPGTLGKKPFAEQLKDMFSLHSSERRGIFLLMMILLLLVGWVVYEQWFYAPAKVDLGPIREEMDRWVAQRRSDGLDKDTAAIELFDFDPNVITREDWKKLGLSDRQINGIFNYKEKGGRFRVKADVARMYTIPPGTFARLEPFILLPDTLERTAREQGRYQNKYDRKDRSFQQGTKEPWPDRDRKVIGPMDINLADTTELVTLPGIGPAFARGIVKYRNSLGGYVSLDQLSEVYVLRDKPDAVDRLKQILFIGNAGVHRIPINSVTAEELDKHPYINRKIANGLVNYREQHGPFPSVEAIKGSVLINDSLYERIAPYLTVE